MEHRHENVVILGAGLAGLSLARHLLLDTDKTVLMLERRDEVPPKRQKVGESTVQLAGYYFSKVLDLEEHLLRRHFLKNNLRFHWKTAGHAADAIEGYSQSLIREMSNVASYQLDRNVFETELLRCNQDAPRFSLATGVRGMAVDLGDGGCHRVRYTAGGEAVSLTADWVVDATGRGKLFAKRRKLTRPSPVRHGSFFWWVDGLVDVERLTDRSRRDVRLDRRRRLTGHLPTWLATNHFMGEGFWFWVIPLHGKTSLGLVYDRERVDTSEVFSVDKATEWVCREFPALARDLPDRRVLDCAGFKDFAYDCVQTLSAERWALTGEAGRFSDPLYSPGSDLIAIHNTLIVDAIRTGDEDGLRTKCKTHEQLMRSAYAAYVPSYTQSYDVLGDQETFALKYAWELSIYFAFYVFPFLNDLFTDRRFGISYLRSFSRLGPLNRGVQKLLTGYYHWKKGRGMTTGGPSTGSAVGEVTDFDFTELETLGRAKSIFQKVGRTVREARQVLHDQLAGLEELARFFAAHIASVVLDDARVLLSRRFVESLDPETLDFDPEALRVRWERLTDDGGIYPWSFDPFVLDRFVAGMGAGRELAEQVFPEQHPVADEVSS